MSKRIKYAKLRLAKPNDATNVSGDAGEQEPKAVSVGENGARNCKTSKYFSDVLKEPCSSIQSTFEEIDIEPPDGDHDEPKCGGENSRRRSAEPSTSNGPKMPKVRKTRGNVLISNFLNSQTDAQDEDFEEQPRPAPITQKPTTKAQRVAKKGSASRRAKIRNQLDIRNVFKTFKTDDEVLQELLKEHSASEHVDPEQLQLALAMSRSLVDRGENSNRSVTSTEDHATNSLSSTEHRIVGIRTTLEQFGFRCKNSYTDYDLNIIFGSARCKNVKKIKHKRATNLVLRSAGELTEFINAKVRDFFPDMLVTEESVCSISNARSRLTHLFWIAQAEQESIDIMEKYYVSELVDVNPAPVGCMLKDWSKVPGREATPERQISATCREDNVSLPGIVQVVEADQRPRNSA
ncbi:structure-specific endonuclease subunit SLX4-like [Anopheles bellator]|uniref:structure-specific endonuclease subunit SLX4-like n=1 Tax=Anopheles bellator TaxID=139047 RepID=UPI0026470B79|nr:structure-specific endonuclease subunit SLX4-like [Anopheles bellator]